VNKNMRPDCLYLLLLNIETKKKVPLERIPVKNMQNTAHNRGPSMNESKSIYPLSAVGFLYQVRKIPGGFSHLF